MLLADPSLRLGRLKVTTQMLLPIIVRVRTPHIQTVLNLASRPLFPLHNKGRDNSILMTILYRVSDSGQSLPSQYLWKRLGEAWLLHRYLALSAL